MASKKVKHQAEALSQRKRKHRDKEHEQNDAKERWNEEHGGPQKNARRGVEQMSYTLEGEVGGVHPEDDEEPWYDRQCEGGMGWEAHQEEHFDQEGINDIGCETSRKRVCMTPTREEA
jgi:hypothetical protein